MLKVLGRYTKYRDSYHEILKKCESGHLKVWGSAQEKLLKRAPTRKSAFIANFEVQLKVTALCLALLYLGF
jgi:hypothetical protein